MPSNRSLIIYLNRLSDLLVRRWRAPSITVPVSRKPSGKIPNVQTSGAWDLGSWDCRRSVRGMRTRRAEALRELSGRVVAAAAPRCGRTLRRSTHSLAPPTISRTKDNLPAPERLRVDRWMAAAAARSGGIAAAWIGAVRRRAARDARICSWRLANPYASLSLPVKLFEALLSAFRQDVTVKRYRDVGSHDGLLPALGKPGWTSRAPHCRVPTIGISMTASDAMCAALQLTNFWQDLKIDFDRGRIYLPEDERERHGATGTRSRRRQHHARMAARAVDGRRAHAAALRRGSIRLRRRQRTPSL